MHLAPLTALAAAQRAPKGGGAWPAEEKRPRRSLACLPLTAGSVGSTTSGIGSSALFLFLLRCSLCESDMRLVRLEYDACSTPVSLGASPVIALDRPSQRPWTTRRPEAEEESDVTLASRLMLRLMVLYQWFLMALSVRPGRSFAISAHLLPTRCWASYMYFSSSSVHGSFLMSGSRWFSHLVLHCFPDLRIPDVWERVEATTDHFLVPWVPTRRIIESSSIAVHARRSAFTGSSIS
mmetsp:Transcript_3011/g.5756  ORF Transcript_3011/g.5756 Transcript_3011/m.5756 type:complete len:237 (+) Transcript_3011:103-813(+)